MKTVRFLPLLLLLALVLSLAPAPAARADDAAAYAPVLSALRAAAAEPEPDPFAHEDAFSYLFFMPYVQAVPGALLTDLNADGVPELLLGNASPDAGQYGPVFFYDLYTLIDGAPKHVVSSGERYRYYLRGDGLIAFEGSSGAAYSYVALYRFGGVGLSCLRMLLTDENGCYAAEGETYDSSYAHAIDRDRWNALADDCRADLITAPPFTPLDREPLPLDLSAVPRPEDAAYGELARQYRAALAEPWTYLTGATPLVHGALLYDCFIEPGELEGTPALRWQRLDLNGDGTDELLLTLALLGEYGETLEETAYELYVLKDGAARPLFELLVGPRWGSRLLPTADGHLLLTRADRQRELYHLDADGALVCDGVFTPDDSVEYGAHYRDADGNQLSAYDLWESLGGSATVSGQDF